MVAVRMCDQGPLDASPRIDIEITRFAVESTRGRPNEGLAIDESGITPEPMRSPKRVQPKVDFPNEHISAFVSYAPDYGRNRLADKLGRYSDAFSSERAHAYLLLEVAGLDPAPSAAIG